MNIDEQIEQMRKIQCKIYNFMIKKDMKNNTLKILFNKLKIKKLQLKEKK